MSRKDFSALDLTKKAERKQTTRNQQQETSNKKLETRNEPEKQPDVGVAFKLPADIVQKLRAYSYVERVTQKDALTKILGDFLTEYEQENKPLPTKRTF